MNNEDITMDEIEKAIRILDGNYKNFVLRYKDELVTVKEIIAMLKAQKPKVMTFADAILNTNHDVVWIELNGDSIVEPAINMVATNDSASFISPLSGDDDCTLKCDRILYGKTWRCWTSKPTDEQRANTPWND